MDPVANAAIASFLQSSGPWGAVVLLIGVVVFLYRRTVDLQDQLSTMAEKRVAEGTTLADRTADGLVKSTTQLASVNLLLEGVSRNLQDLKDASRLIPSAIEGISKQVEANANKVDRLADSIRNDRS